METTDYRPEVIEFDVSTDDTIMPLILGEFPEHDEVDKFIADNKIVTINQAITVNRHMDTVEKNTIRQRYNDLLENILPRLEALHSEATTVLREAKEEEKQAAERVSATLTEAKILAKDVKRGLKEMRLDDLFTHRIPFKGRYYYYTYIDKRLKLCRITDIPDHEKNEVWNVMTANDEALTNVFGDGETQTQEGEKE